jgi:hypothetical protein
MKSSKTRQYFFVDEAGDPTFYDRFGNNIVGQEGCSKILLLGFIRTQDATLIRQKLESLRQEIIEDPYLQGIPSLKKTAVAFHAKNDCPEVRERVYRLIASFDFKAEFVVARKIESIFKKKHQGRESLFYDDLIIKLFQNKLHTVQHINIHFATRGNKTRQAPLEDAIRVATLVFEKRWGIKNNSHISIHPQSPSGEPCLQVADYMNWAVQRAFLRSEDRYLKFVEDKISYLVDVYDFKKYPRNFYNRKNVFNINKISPL